jgi:hypothetical protein
LHGFAQERGIQQFEGQTLLEELAPETISHKVMRVVLHFAISVKEPQWRTFSFLTAPGQ